MEKPTNYMTPTHIHTTDNPQHRTHARMHAMHLEQLALHGQAPVRGLEMLEGRDRRALLLPLLVELWGQEFVLVEGLHLPQQLPDGVLCVFEGGWFVRVGVGVCVSKRCGGLMGCLCRFAYVNTWTGLYSESQAAHLPHTPPPHCVDSPRSW
jgi:hypothetical protein